MIHVHHNNSSFLWDYWWGCQWRRSTTFHIHIFFSNTTTYVGHSGVNFVSVIENSQAAEVWSNPFFHYWPDVPPECRRKSLIIPQSLTKTRSPLSVSLTVTRAMENMIPFLSKRRRRSSFWLRQIIFHMRIFWPLDTQLEASKSIHTGDYYVYTLLSNSICFF